MTGLYLDPDRHPGEIQEREHCRRRGIPFARLTVAEQRRAGSLTFLAAAQGHRRLVWCVPAHPGPLGAVWPERHLWGVRVFQPYRNGPVVLTAKRRRFGRRYIVSTLRR